MKNERKIYRDTAQHNLFKDIGIQMKTTRQCREGNTKKRIIDENINGKTKKQTKTPAREKLILIERRIKKKIKET